MYIVLDQTPDCCCVIVQRWGLETSSSRFTASCIPSRVAPLDATDVLSALHKVGQQAGAGRLIRLADRRQGERSTVQQQTDLGTNQKEMKFSC